MSSSSAIAKDVSDIWRCIQDYGAVYKRFEDLQKLDKARPEKKRLLPAGDQKTGVIGEFYALLFAMSKYGHDAVSLGDNHSGDEYDILVNFAGGARKHIQVKCVSDYAKKRRASKMNLEKHGQDSELYVIYLNEEFFPEKFWIVKNLRAVDVAKGFTVPHPKTPGSGSQFFADKDRCQDWTSELEQLLINEYEITR